MSMKFDSPASTRTTDTADIDSDDSSVGPEDADGPATATVRPGSSAQALASLIESEIVPRLLLVHKPARTGTADADGSEAVLESPATFARKTVELSVDDLIAHVQAQIANGVDWNRLCLDQLAPTARHLGEMWENDDASFTDVTLGLARLHQLLHEIARSPDDAAHPGMEQKRAYLVSLPGEQHTFGLAMLDEFFQKAGWLTWVDNAASGAEILERVATLSLDVIGVSVARQEMLDGLPALIKQCREASRNPNIRIMVGGRVFTDDETLADRIGADGTAADAEDAVRLATQLADRAG